MEYRSCIVRTALPAIFLLALVGMSQTVSAQLPTGYETKSEAEATGYELRSQSDLWIFEVRFKPMRMQTVTLTDPKTGRKSREIVWYLVYQALIRPQERRGDDSDTRPDNDDFEDAQLTKPLFVPDCTLITDDNGVQRIYHDVIFPEGEAAIEKREGRKYLNVVEAIDEIPDPTAHGALKETVVDGVIMWRGVDPRTDFFKVMLDGFSNGYRHVKGPVSNEQLLELKEAGAIDESTLLWKVPKKNPLASIGAWVRGKRVPGLFGEDGPASSDAPPDDGEAADGEATEGETAPKETETWFYAVPGDQAKNSTIWRRTIVQNYWRPGDRFAEKEEEIRRKGEPVWIYRPGSAKNPTDIPAPPKPASTTAGDDS
jgi:hypothetical protein